MQMVGPDAREVRSSRIPALLPKPMQMIPVAGPAFEGAVAALAGLPAVGAVLLAGSRAAGTADAESDVDVYVYADTPLDAQARRRALAPWCGEMEWDNRFWEPEDDGRLRDGTAVEFIHRTFAGLEEAVSAVVERGQASVGYSTCVWANLLDSRILFDRDGRAAALQDRFRVPYPAALQAAVIAKNLPLLAGCGAAYLHQIEKALQRDDVVSVHHRLSALLASYCDILFAANARPHPGEKRLLVHLSALPELPASACADIRMLLAFSVLGPAGLPALIRRLDSRLREWLIGRGLLPQRA
jgi:hypothetical protein